MKINRRDFLGLTAISILSSKELYDIGTRLTENYNIKTIYELLPEQVHRFTSETVLEIDDRKLDLKAKGVGIFYQGNFITTAHIINDGNLKQRTPFGMMIRQGNIVRQDTYLDSGVGLEPLLLCWKTDSAVFRPETPQPDFPCKTGTPHLGLEAYIIGNPALKGSNIRRVRVSTLEGMEDDETYTEGCFGIDSLTIGGDSGSPVVSLEKELLGLVRSNANGLGYINPIDRYNIKKEQKKYYQIVTNA